MLVHKANPYGSEMDATISMSKSGIYTMTMSATAVSLLAVPLGVASGSLGFLLGRRLYAPVESVQLQTSLDHHPTEQELRIVSLMSSLHAVTTEVGAHVGQHSAEIDKITQSMNAEESTPDTILAAGKLLISANQHLQSQLVEAKAEIDRQRAELGQSLRDSLTDPLTGISNRRAFDHGLRNEIAIHRRKSKPFSLVMIDVDHFKRLNDAHGHMVGDQVLKAFAKSLTSAFREKDLVNRYGGEEFAVILPQTGAAEAYGLAEQARAAIADCRYLGGDVELRVTASMGVAEFRSDDSDENLITRADKALYAAKKGGRNRVFSHDEMTSTQSETADVGQLPCLSIESPV